jgi:orotate phosphoribosyltransferase
MIITGRHEQYRKVTMDWLEEHGLSVDPKKLIMRPFEKDDNIWVEQVSLFKGGLYKISNFNLFIESSLAQSERIKDISKKPVFCPSFGMLP